MAASRARYLVVRPGAGPDGETSSRATAARDPQRLEPGLWKPAETELRTASRRLRGRLDAVAVQHGTALASVSVRYPTAGVSPELLQFFEYFVPPARRIAEHRGIFGGAETSESAVVYRAFARPKDLGRAMDAVSTHVLNRHPSDAPVERWLSRRVGVARASMANPSSLSAALLAGYVPDPEVDPMAALLEGLDRYRSGGELLLLREYFSVHDGQRAQVLLVGPDDPEAMLDDAERHLKRLAAAGLPFELVPAPPSADDINQAKEAEVADRPPDRWLVNDPGRSMALLQSSCPLEAPERGALVLVTTGRLISRRLFRRFRTVSGEAYGPSARVDGEGRLSLRVEVPRASVPAALADIEALLTAPAEAWELDETRLEMASEIAPELHGGATLPYVLMTDVAGVLPADEIASMVSLLYRFGPTDVDGALVGCAGERVVVVQGPADKLELDGFVQPVPSDR